MKFRYIAMIALMSIVLLVCGCTSAANNPTPAPVVATPYPTPHPTPIPTPKQVDVGFGRSNPAPVGTTIPFTWTMTDGTVYDVSMVLEQVMRGDQANQMIKSTNMFNPTPVAGKEYLLAKFKISVTGSTDENKPMTISDVVELHAVSRSGVTYDYNFAVLPDPKIASSVYSGGSTEGWEAFMVNQDDSAPLIIFGNSATGEGIWFKTS